MEQGNLQDNGQSRRQHWYVMTHLEPRKIEQQLKELNLQREDNGQSVYEYFIPYQFIKRRISNPEAEAEDIEALQTLRTPQEVDDNNAIRTALHSFIFINTTPKGIGELVNAEWNVYSRLRLQYYRNAQGMPVMVPDGMMQRFINACLDQREKFEIHPPSANIALDTEVIIRRGAFKTLKARVTNVRHTNEGIRLTLSISFFANTRDIRLEDYTLDDILLDENSSDLVSDDFINRIQGKLLAIMSRKVHHKETLETQRADMLTLSRLYHYRHIEIADETRYAQFQAMMLICARLRFDTEGQTLFYREVQRLLASYEQPLTTEVATARATLLIALHIATGDASYRNEAKTLVRDHLSQSPHLRRFISLIR